MIKNELIDVLNNDLKNEWKHHNFYLHNASNVIGLHSIEYKEFLLKQAASEMNHVSKFSDIIVGLGGLPTKESNEFPSLFEPSDIIEYAIKMEEEVIKNYVERIRILESLDGVDPYWVILFLEEQIQDSRQDRDEMVQMIKKSKINTI